MIKHLINLVKGKWVVGYYKYSNKPKLKVCHAVYDGVHLYAIHLGRLCIECEY